MVRTWLAAALASAAVLLAAAACGDGSPAAETSTRSASVADLERAICSHPGADWVCEGWTVESIDSTTSGESDGVAFADLDFTMSEDATSDVCRFLRRRLVLTDEDVWAIEDAESFLVQPDACETPLEVHCERFADEAIGMVQDFIDAVDADVTLLMDPDSRLVNETNEAADDLATRAEDAGCSEDQMAELLRERAGTLTAKTEFGQQVVDGAQGGDWLLFESP